MNIAERETMRDGYRGGDERVDIITRVEESRDKRRRRS